MRVDANVVYGGDGDPQAKEVTVKDGDSANGESESLPPPPPPPPGAAADAGRFGKKRKHEDGAPPQMGPGGAMYPWGGGGPAMPGMGGPSDPYFKTQPCPYYRVG